MDEFRAGLGDAWANVAAFIPKLIGFLLILVIGYFIAKAIGKLVDAVLERVGFDRAVERGGVKKALANSKYDASSILGKVVFYGLMLFVLQLAFGVFPNNPITELIQGVIAYLPNVFAAIIIIVVASAIAAAVKEIVEASLGGLSYGRGLAIGSSVAILVLGVFAALDQLEIAPTIVNTLFIGLVAIIAGSAIVAIGGGGIKTMQTYWERSARRVEQETDNIKRETNGASDRIQRRTEERKEQLQGASVGGGSTTASPSPTTTGTVAGGGASSLGGTQEGPTYGSGSDRQ